jgi:hypothetical protein
MNAFSTIIALAVTDGVVYMVRLAILQGGHFEAVVVEVSITSSSRQIRVASSPCEGRDIPTAFTFKLTTANDVRSQCYGAQEQRKARKA